MSVHISITTANTKKFVTNIALNMIDLHRALASYSTASSDKSATNLNHFSFKSNTISEAETPHIKHPFLYSGLLYVKLN